MKNIKSIQEIDTLVEENLGVLAYFSHERCNVCKTLKPKLSEYFFQHFPKMEQIYIDIEKLPEVAAQHSIFTVPVVIVFFEGKETCRKARAFGIQELAELVNRPYSLMFD